MYILGVNQARMHFLLEFVDPVGQLGDLRLVFLLPGSQGHDYGLGLGELEGLAADLVGLSTQLRQLIRRLLKVCFQFHVGV